MSDFEHGLQLIIMPGQRPPLWQRTMYETAFETWRTVWEEAANEIENFPKKVYSNDFTRQDEVLAVFRGDDCTSLGFWTELDMSYEASRADQYFQSWDSESLNQLTKYGMKVGKYSYFTVSKPYRSWSREVGISLTDLQVGLFGLRFLDSDCSAMTGTTRNNRKINLVCERGGAQIIKKNVMQYGSEVDLMAWYKHTVKPYKEIEFWAQKLWMNKLDFKQIRRNNVSRETSTYTLR